MSKRWLGALAAIIALCGPSAAQDWQNRPIHVIVPYTPGSASDIMPRTIFAKVQERLGQPIVIENRAGAASTLGTGAVAKADPDGYTFLATSSAFTTVPLTFANLPYDPLEDSFDEFLTQRCQTRIGGFTFALRNFQRRCKTNHVWNILCACTSIAFMATTGLRGQHGRAVPNIQNADTFRAVKFVRTQRH